MGMVYHLIFLFESSRLLNSILSFKKFTSRTQSFIHQLKVSFLVSWVFIASLLNSCKSSVRVPFLVSFLVSYSHSWCHPQLLEYHSLPFGCHSEFSVHYVEFLSSFFVHHLHNLAYLFIVLGFTLSFGVHIIVLPFYSINNGKCEIITLFQLGFCENIG